MAGGKYFRHFVWVLATVAPPLTTLAAQLPPADTSRAVSAEVTNLRYDVTFDRATAAERTMKIVTTFDVGTGADVVLLSLPAWTPGAYEISSFARWVVDFAATAGDGSSRPLPWDKLDYDTWRVRPGASRTVKVSFTYIADTLDNAMAWARPDFLLFNGTNVFLYPEGRSLTFAARVTVHTDPAWRVATGMRWEGSGQEAWTTTYSATTYHDLVDMPFFVGRFDVDSALVSGKWLRYATYPQGSVSGASRMQAWDQLKRVVPPQVAVFGEVPWDTYTVMQIADSSYQGASGLEHQSSHVDVVTPMAIGSEFQPSLYAHEIFHAWNVKRLRPADLWPYEYSRPQPTPWLWVSEGVTDYYADLAEVRGGVVDENTFYALTAAKMKEVGDARPIALEDASLNTWIHPVDGTGYIYYPKGSLAGFMLDVMIRDASDNKRSLDTVMRELYQSVYKSGRGFSGSDWWSAVSRAAGGRSFADFAARYIDGREPFPWDRALPLAGIRMTRPNEPRLGVYTMQDSAGIVVTHVEPGGAAAAAGVREGDHLLAIGDIAVDDALFAERFRTKFAKAAEGSPLPVRVRRGAETLTLAGKLRFAPGDIVLDADPKAPAKAVRVRNGILRGVTG
jgi:predicted metalloprotease with PDZ domain